MSRRGAKPHERAQAEKRVGRAAPLGDPWAARIREAIDAAYHDPQRDAAHDPALLSTILTGRGAGKTTCYRGRLVDEMAHTAHGKYIYACPTLGMAVELLWEPLKQMCSDLGLEQGIDCEFKEAPREGGKIFNLRTGSRLKLFGVDDAKQVNLCRGQPFDGVVGDEVAYWDIDLVDNFVRRVISPRIGERNGWISLASSPGHVLRGFFFDRTRDGSPDHRPYSKRNEPEYANWRGWSSHSWNLADVTGIRNEGDAPTPEAAARYPALVALRRSHIETKSLERWSDANPIWMREYEGRWARDNTTMVFQLDGEKNLWSPHGAQALEGIQGLKTAIAALPKGLEWHYVLAADKGSPRVIKEGEGKKREGDPYAINILAFAPADPQRRKYHVYFLEKTGLYARLIAQVLLGADETSPTGCMSHDKPGGVFGAIGWPDGMVLDGDQALIEELANVYGIRFEKAEKRPDYKAGAIELTNGDLVDGRILVIEDSPMHTQLTGLQWAEQDSGALKEDPSQPNHSTDCLIYARKKIQAMFDSGVVGDGGGDGGAAPPSASTYDDPMGLDDPGGDPFDELEMDNFDDLEGRF